MNKGKIGYHLNIKKTCYESESSNDRFGDWSESWSNTFVGIHRLEKNQSSDVNADLTFEVGEKCYVLWAEYSSGDSFGYGYRKYIAPVGVFKTYEAAKACEDFIMMRNKLGYVYYYSSTNEYPLETDDFQSPDGQIVKVDANRWLGYFDNLEELNIAETTMQRPKERESWI